MNAHLNVDEGKKKNKKKNKKEKSKSKDDETHPGVSLFASFFRTASEHDKNKNEVVFSHSIAWAVMDHKSGKYYNVSLLDPAMPEFCLRQLQEDTDGHIMADERLKKATMEMLAKGVVPYPDRLLKKPATILGKNLSRLPDKDPKAAESSQKKSEGSTKTTKSKKSGCCCWSAKSVLQSVATGPPRLALKYDDNTFVKNRDGSYDLCLEDRDVHNVKVKLHFVPNGEPIRNGEDGVVDGEGVAPDFFYYSLPNCTVTGSVTFPDEEKFDQDDAKIEKKNYFVLGDDDDSEKEPAQTLTSKVVGKGWYDHQFGSFGKDTVEEIQQGTSKQQQDKPKNTDPSYNWLSLQLDNGYQLTCSEYYMYQTLSAEDQAKEKPKFYAILVDPKGQPEHLDVSDFTFAESSEEKWVSTKTFREYPVKWNFSVPSKGIKIDLEATDAQQEFITIISKPAFWEGSVKATGLFGNKSITGKGFVERKGFCHRTTQTMEHFFKSVSRETLKSVHKILPFNPEGEKLHEIVSHKKNVHYTEYIDNVQFSKALIEPIRAVLDRGGKSWRSYAALACCDMVGGNSQRVRGWLSLPELMHVGSLIVDDVQDRSDIRRGGPCSHILYGEDVAINAGTMAYFVGQICVYQGDGSAEQKVDIYNLYFEAMRAAHSGQAMDIHGLDYMMPDVVENGGDLCRQRVIAIHRLKSAIPASSLAGMGCRLGGGSKKQSAALSSYYESLGIAFQIVDDVLNLKGFHDGLKTKGEDITAGKVTYPIAKAMGRLEKADRTRLWELVSSKPDDIETIGKAIALIDKANGIEDSYKEAKQMMEDAWHQLDPLIVDSTVKLNLRAFSHYVLDRVY